MDERSNVERMRLFVDQVQDKGRIDLIDELVHAEFRNHTAAPTQSPDRSGVRTVTAALHAAFSDFRAEILHCIGEGDLVATHKVFRGTQTGEWFGIAPSGKPVEWAVMDLVRYRDGLMVEHWAVVDALAMLRQTGALA